MRPNNQFQFIGNLGEDPSVRYSTMTGKPIIQFPLGVDENYRNSSGEEIKRVSWHNMVVFGSDLNKGLAKTIMDYMGKGTQVLVQGRIRKHVFESDDRFNEDGSKRKEVRYGFIVEQMRILSRWKNEDAREDALNSNTDGPQKDFEDEDIPMYESTASFASPNDEAEEAQ